MALDLLKFCFENRDYLENYVDWAIPARTWGIKEFQDFLKSFEKEKLPTETVFIYHAGSIIGSGRIADCKPYPPQIMYFVDKDWQGKGLATCIAKKLLEQAFQVRRYSVIEVLVDETNLASQRVVEKIGGKKHDDWYGLPHAWKESGHMYVYRIYNPEFEHEPDSHPLSRGDRQPANYVTGAFYNYLLSFLPKT